MFKKIVYFLPSILIMSVIFYLSSLTSTGIGGSLTVQFLIHKSLHLLVYSVLSISFYFALSNTTSKNKAHIKTISIFLSFLYGIIDEIHQSFVPGRGAKFTDTLFDLAGSLLGLYLYKIFRNCQINYHSNRNH